jgi:integrase
MLLRVKVKGVPRQYVDLTELFPADAVDVAAAKAKDRARKGLLVGGKLVGLTTDVRLTLGQVIERFAQKRVYLDVLKRTELNGVPLGSRIMADLTGDDFVMAADLVQTKAAKKGRNGGLDARRHFLAASRHLFHWAIEKRILKSTPFLEAGVSMIPIGASRSRDRRLQGDEETRLRAACDPYTRDLMDAALETGCRGGELRGLQWSDIREDEIVLPAHKTKTKKLRRLPISPTLQAMLDRRRKGPDGNDLPADAHVFGDDTGKPISRRLAHRWWRKACKAANIDDLKFHDLRHEFGSQLLEAGGELHEVQATLGHTTLTMTGRYLNATQVGVRAAFKTLDAKRRRKRLRVVS